MAAKQPGSKSASTKGAATASSAGKKKAVAPSKSSVYKAQLARQQAAAARQRRVMLVTACVVGLAAVGAILVVVSMLKKAKPSPPPVVQKAEEPSPGQAEQLREAESAWEAVKGRQPTKAYKPLLDKGASQIQSMRTAWSAGRYSESATAMDQLLKSIGEIESLDRQREAALVAQQDATAAMEKAKAGQAQQQAPRLLVEAQAAFDAGGKQFGDDEFATAAERWREASEAFGRAAVAADQALAAQAARKVFDERLIKRFDRATLDAHGGAAMSSAIALIADSEKDIAEYRFDDARKKIEQAQSAIPSTELAVQQQIGAHYYW